MVLGLPEMNLALNSISIRLETTQTTCYLVVLFLQFSSPYDFLANVLHSKNAKKFVELKREIASHFNDHYLFSKSTVTDPKVGQVCSILIKFVDKRRAYGYGSC